MVEFVEWGERVEYLPEQLSNPQLLGLLRACSENQHFKVIELRVVQTTPPHAVIVVEASDGTIAPKNTVGLRARERLAITFKPGTQLPVDVRALRADFPDVVHLNGVPPEEPASLCLYENWGHEERQWTPEKHLGRILWWLRHTADGTLHQQDQALEQLYYTTGTTVVLPAEFEEHQADELGAIYFRQVGRPDGRVYLIASTTKPNVDASPIQPLMVDLSSVGNMPILRAPRTLGELNDQLEGLGLDFRPAFEAGLKRQFRLSAEGNGAEGTLLLLIVRIPRVREGVVERTECRGFLVPTKFDEVGVKLGVLFRPVPGGGASVIDDLEIGGAKPPPATDWVSLPIELVELSKMPSRSFARMVSGVPEEAADFVGVLAGVGSLGSVLADLWTRESWGRWTFIDPDYVAPHNLVRHTATFGTVGLPKVQVVHSRAFSALGHARDSASAILGSANSFDCTNVFGALAGADLLVDASTTIEVPRDWSEQELPRSSSVFFAHSGMSSVLLLEDRARQIRLSALEAQYYRAVINEPWGESHLQSAGRVRVGVGCRDHSFLISYELVKLHAAHLARRLRRAVSSEVGVIAVWTLDDSTGAVAAVSVPVHSVRSVDRLDWKVRWDEGIEIKIRAMRKACLPYETGGVLVGVVDHKLRTVTIVDASEAPADSTASTTSFVRGSVGSQAYVERCEALTHQMVSYVGEWHSHPEGHRADPSATDFKLLATLAARLAADGVPALMMIVSEDHLTVSIGRAPGI